MGGHLLGGGRQGTEFGREDVVLDARLRERQHGDGRPDLVPETDIELAAEGEEQVREAVRVATQRDRTEAEGQAGAARAAGDAVAGRPGAG